MKPPAIRLTFDCVVLSVLERKLHVALARRNAVNEVGAADPFPIPPKQIEGALGHPIHHTFPSDYKTVSTALNSGVPLALTGDTEIAAAFDSFTRRIVDPEEMAPSQSTGKRSRLGLDRLASMW